MGMDTVFKDHHTGFAGVVAYTGKHHGLGAQSGQLGKKAIHIGLIIGFLIGGVRQEAGFCDVGKKDICLAAELFHFGNIGIIKGRIELAVVCHSRVHDVLAAGVTQIVHNIRHIGDLLGASQVSRINGVKADALFLPVGSDAGHILGQIPDGKAGEAGSMGGKNC